MNNQPKPAQKRILRLDEMGKRAAAARVSRQVPPEEAIRNSWVADMYQSIEVGGGRVQNVIIDRTAENEKSDGIY